LVQILATQTRIACRHPNGDGSLLLGNALEVKSFTPVASSSITKRIIETLVEVNSDYDGIVIEGDGGFGIKRNNVTYKSPDVGAGWSAFRLKGSANNKVIGNVTTTDPAVGLGYYYGYEVTNSQSNLFCCNMANLAYVGMNFAGACNNTLLRQSDYRTNSTNLALTIGATISRQRHHWNRWKGTSTAAQHFTATVIPVPPMTQAGITQAILQSQFIVANPQGTQVFPLAITPNNIDWFTGENDIESFECEDDEICATEVNANKAIPDDDAIGISEGVFTNTPFGENLQWSGGKRILNVVKEQASWLGYSDAFDSYYANLLTSNIRRFDDVEQILAKIDAPNAAQTTALAAIETEVESLYQEQNAKDAQLLLNPNDEVAENRRAEILDLRAQAYDAQEAIEDAITANNAEFIAAVTTANEAIIPSNVIEQNLQKVNRIYLQTLAIGNMELSAAQKMIVTSIANQCPLVGGEGVFKARALFALYAHKQFKDKDICNYFGEGTPPPSSKVQQTNNTFVFPNPANELLNFQVANNQTAYVTIRDISGRIIQSFTFEGQFSISTENYPNGMIFCEITQNNQHLATERVVIQH
jgi:hypothetical protein